MKKKLIQATCLFFVMMLIFTILSRVSDSVNVIQIQTKNPANQMITHEVKGSGKVEGSQEVAVFVLENLQARERGKILMAVSNQRNYLLLACGNKSETAMGYCTLYCEKRGYFIEAVPEQHSGGFEESGR